MAIGCSIIGVEPVWDCVTKNISFFFFVELGLFRFIKIPIKLIWFNEDRQKIVLHILRHWHSYTVQHDNTLFVFHSVRLVHRFINIIHYESVKTKLVKNVQSDNVSSTWLYYVYVNMFYVYTCPRVFGLDAAESPLALCLPKTLM